MQLMGHSSVTTTEVYSKMNQHEILEHFKSFKSKWETKSGKPGNEVKVISFEKTLQLQRTSNP